MSRVWILVVMAAWGGSVLAATAAPPNITELKQQRAQAIAENTLIEQFQAAQAAKDWPKAESSAEQLTKLDGSRWEYRRALADTRYSAGKFDQAVADYQQAIGAALTSSRGDPKKTAAAVSNMYINQGNAYLKLKQAKQAMAAFTHAAEHADNPAIAWFDLCATAYNVGDVDAALAACDKAIAADPAKADAYFIKGSLLVGNSTTDAAGKTVAPPGAVEALQKYLELAPNGAHVDDVKQMLGLLGAPPR